MPFGTLGACRARESLCIQHMHSMMKWFDSHMNSETGVAYLPLHSAQRNCFAVCLRVQQAASRRKIREMSDMIWRASESGTVWHCNLGLLQDVYKCMALYPTPKALRLSIRNVAIVHERSYSTLVPDQSPPSLCEVDLLIVTDFRQCLFKEGESRTGFSG